ncbi:hypothetical protein, partial [Plasmodium yoelii yoelii]
MIMDEKHFHLFVFLKIRYFLF